MNNHGICSVIILAVTAATITGCGGDKFDRCVVSGKVTYAGKPIKQGQIRFVAIENTKLPAAGATIVEGEYKADNKGGVPAGNYRVEFLMFQSCDGSNGMNDIVQQVLPKKFNEQSPFTLSIPHGGEPVDQNYELN